ncbi:EscU/YscU/HrcU family type III secretion system export apparatus switch protein [Cupriavidus basilensis]
MSTEELRREHRELQGDPHIVRRRQLALEVQYSALEDRMRIATAIVFSARHAVALYYPGDGTLPMVIAKGSGESVQRIRQMAESHLVPTAANAGLAERLHDTVPMDTTIDRTLFRDVAALLRWAEGADAVGNRVRVVNLLNAHKKQRAPDCCARRRWLAFSVYPIRTMSPGTTRSGSCPVAPCVYGLPSSAAQSNWLFIGGSLSNAASVRGSDAGPVVPSSLAASAAPQLPGACRQGQRSRTAATWRCRSTVTRAERWRAARHRSRLACRAAGTRQWADCSDPARCHWPALAQRPA